MRKIPHTTILAGSRLLLVWLACNQTMAQESGQETAEPGLAGLPGVSQAAVSPWEQLIGALEKSEWTQVQAVAETLQQAADSEPLQRATATLVLKALGFTQAKEGELDPITTENLRALEARKADARASLNLLKREEKELQRKVDDLRAERQKIDQKREGELALAFLDILTSTSSSGGTNMAQHARGVTQGKLDAKDAEIRRVQEELAIVKRRTSEANAEIIRIDGEIARTKKEGLENWKVRQGEFKAEMLKWMEKLIEEAQMRAAAALANFYPNDTALAQVAQRARDLAAIRKEAQRVLAEAMAPVLESFEKKAYWTARQQLSEIPAGLGDRMKVEEFARVIEKELLVQRKKIEAEIERVDRKVEEVKTQGQKDYRVGQAALKELRAAFPDWPENQALDVQRLLAGWRIEQIEARVAAELRPIEEAAKADPKVAWEKIQGLRETTPEDETPEAIPLLEAAQDRVIVVWSGTLVEQRDAQWRRFEQFTAAHGSDLETGRDPLLTSKGHFVAEAAVVPASEERMKGFLTELARLNEMSHGATVRAQVQGIIQETSARLAAVEEVAGKIEERRNRLSRDATLGGGALALSFLGTTAFCWWRRKRMLAGE